jgi:DNA repair protein RadA/Sms
MKEAAKLGFDRALGPAATKSENEIKISGFRTLGQLVDHMLGRG